MMIQSVWKNLTGLQKAAEHFWCDFKWAKNSSPNTNDLYIHYMDTRGVQLLSADQSSSSTLTESSFLFDSCLIRDGDR